MHTDAMRSYKSVTDVAGPSRNNCTMQVSLYRASHESSLRY